LTVAKDSRIGVQTTPPTDKDMKYSCVMLFPKAVTVTALKAANHPAAQWMSADNCAGLYQDILAVARGNFGPDVDMAQLKLPLFRDGDKAKASGKVDENAKGYVVIKSTSREKPQLFRQDKTIITDPSELYAGCWVRAVLTVAPYTLPQHGVTLYLAGVQKLADDATFSSRPRCEDAFDAVATDATFMGAPAAVAPMAVAAPKNPWEA
jgi:hypothetical protein